MCHIHRTKKLLRSKGDNRRREKATYRVGKTPPENIYLIRGKFPKCIRNSYNSIAKEKERMKKEKKNLKMGKGLE